MTTASNINLVPSISSQDRASAINITLDPLASDPVNGVSAIVAGFNGIAPTTTYSFTAREGATYNIIDQSFFDPYLRLYNPAGDVVAISDESYDRFAEVIFYDTVHHSDGGSYNVDVILEWVAPSSGVYYIRPGWDQGSFYDDYSVIIIGDLTNAVKEVIALPPQDVDVFTDRVFNWAENMYPDLLPEHPASVEINGYYARLYSNGNAVGEKDGGIYFYDGGIDGDQSITYVGSKASFFFNAAADGF